MGAFANRSWVQILAWVAAAIIVGLNARLLVQTLGSWIEAAGTNAIWLWAAVVPVVIGCVLLLMYISLPKSWLRRKRAVAPPSFAVDLTPEKYSRVGVALDYGPIDQKVLSHAQTLAKQQSAVLYLFHVVEGVSGQLYGNKAYDDEARMDIEHLESIASQLRKSGLEVQALLGFGRVPEQLVELANKTKIDLLVMGGHRHRGLKDIFFGASITRVRHRLSIPVLVVQ